MTRNCALAGRRGCFARHDVSHRAVGEKVGASPENIVADASRKLAAFDAFHGFMERKTNETIESSQAQIAELGRQIEARRQAMRNAQSELARVTQGCEGEADKLDEVLEFFSLDEGASTHAGAADSAS